MKTITKPVYYCDYCKKHGLAKGAMKRHELLCFNNPANKRPCFNCQHLTKKEETETCGYQYNGAEINRKVNDFYCLAKKTFLYTPQNEIKDNMHEIDNEPMPKECEYYEEINYIDIFKEY